MPLLASMGAMWFPTTINSVMFLWSVVGELMYLPKVKVGSGFERDKCNTRPADVLVLNWFLGKPAAFDHTIT